MSEQYVTQAEWQAYCQQERRKYREQKDRENAELHARWKKEQDRLMNPPTPPPKPERPPEPPEIEDPDYADWLYVQGGGITGIETSEED
jgi:hypothetical protein